MPLRFPVLEGAPNCDSQLLFDHFPPYVFDFDLVLGISTQELKPLYSRNIKEKELELIPGAYEGLIELYKEHKIYLITSRPQELTYETKKWLDKKNVLYNGIYHVEPRCKHLVEDITTFDIFIDDNLKEAIDLLGKVKHMLIFDHPWNQTLDIRKRFKRVRSWQEIVGAVNEISR